MLDLEGVITQDNPYSTSVDMKFWEVMKYTSKIHYRLYTGIMIVNNAWYNRLNDETKEVIDRAARDAALWEWDWIGAINEESRQAILDNGMVINELEDEEVWREASRKCWPQFYDELGGEEFVKKVISIVEDRS